jgi:osmotically-inducible protein OsmY
MMRPRTLLLSLALLGGGIPGRAPAQDPAPAAPRDGTPAPVPPDVALLHALAADPVTAPYHFATEVVGGKIVLKGRVGTKTVYDEAIRIAVEGGFPFVDRLVIDTAEAHRAAAQGAYPIQPILTGPVYGGYGYGPFFLPPAFSYVYPPPLLGRYDDPFFGLEPPVISYPPWWGELSARRLRESGSAVPEAPVVDDTAAADRIASPSGLPGTVEMTIDPLGVAVLRGSVATLADRIAVGRQLAQMPGVTEVINELEVREEEAPPPSPTPTPAPAGEETTDAEDVPPPPPTPAPVVGEKPRAEDVPPPPSRPEAAPAADPAAGDDLEGRLQTALSRLPDVPGGSVRATDRDGVVTLEGSVPTAYEAMRAYRAVQQTPGVRAIVDRLDFEVPDGSRDNPLLRKGRPEDVEPYLEAQVRRQLGDQAHVDRVRLHGDAVEIRGTLRRPEDRPRIEAILRSTPVLRGFRLDPQFLAE